MLSWRSFRDSRTEHQSGATGLEPRGGEEIAVSRGDVTSKMSPECAVAYRLGFGPILDLLVSSAVGKTALVASGGRTGSRHFSFDSAEPFNHRVSYANHREYAN